MQAEILSQGFNFIDFCYVENVQCDPTLTTQNF